MNIALILAGGIGKRLGRDIPKQYISVEGKMIITHCLQVVSTHPKIDAIQIVADEQWREKIYRQMRICEARTEQTTFDHKWSGAHDAVGPRVGYYYYS